MTAFSKNNRGNRRTKWITGKTAVFIVGLLVFEGVAIGAEPWSAPKPHTEDWPSDWPLHWRKALEESGGSFDFSRMNPSIKRDLYQMLTLEHGLESPKTAAEAEVQRLRYLEKVGASPVGAGLKVEIIPWEGAEETQQIAQAAAAHLKQITGMNAEIRNLLRPREITPFDDTKVEGVELWRQVSELPPTEADMRFVITTQRVVAPENGHNNFCFWYGQPKTKTAIISVWALRPISMMEKEGSDRTWGISTGKNREYLPLIGVRAARNMLEPAGRILGIEPTDDSECPSVMQDSPAAMDAQSDTPSLGFEEGLGRRAGQKRGSPEQSVLNDPSLQGSENERVAVIMLTAAWQKKFDGDGRVLNTLISGDGMEETEKTRSFDLIDFSAPPELSGSNPSNPSEVFFSVKTKGGGEIKITYSAGNPHTIRME